MRAAARTANAAISNDNKSVSEQDTESDSDGKKRKRNDRSKAGGGGGGGGGSKKSKSSSQRRPNGAANGGGLAAPSYAIEQYQTPTPPGGGVQATKPATIKIKIPTNNRPANPSPLQQLTSSNVPSEAYTPSSNPGSEDIDYSGWNNGDANGMDLDAADTEDDEAMSDTGSGFQSLDEPVGRTAGKTLPGQQQRVDSWASIGSMGSTPSQQGQGRFAGKSLPGRG